MQVGERLVKVLFAELGRLFSDHQLFLVGGSVRDQILGREAKDLDFATDAEPEQTKALLESWADAVWDPGLAFGTIAAKKGDEVIEITTFRADGPGRKPKVEFVKSLDEDLRRRDFTINAMAIRVGPDGLGELQDPFGGQFDLGNRVIDTPMSPERSFGDDPLRMLRAVRFVSQLGFQTSTRVFMTMRAMAPRLQEISAERITAEMDKLLMGRDPDTAIKLLRQTRLLDFIVPEVTNWHDYWLIGDDVETRWADLLRDIDPTEVEVRLRALKFSNERVRDVTTLVKLCKQFSEIVWFPQEIRRALAAAGPQFVRLVKLLRASDTLLPLATRLLDKEGFPEPVLDGKEVMDILDLKPGPRVGEALAWLWQMRLETGPMSKEHAEWRLRNWASA